MLVTVDISSVLEQQAANVRPSFVGCMHERSHPILETDDKTPDWLSDLFHDCLTG